MSRFKLHPYLIKIRPRNEIGYFKLDSIGKKIDLFDIVDEILKALLPENRNVVVEPLSKTFTISILLKSIEKRIIYGIIKSGEYGLEYDAIDMKRGAYLHAFREESIAELTPFFFMFFIPKNKKFGLLIMQSFKNYGVKYIFESFLNKKLSEFIKGKIDVNITMNIDPILTKELIKKIEEGRLLQFKLLKYKISKDIADRYYIDNPEEVYEERSFKIKRKSSLKLAGKWLNNLTKSKDTALYTFKDDKYKDTYDEIKFVIKDPKGGQETLKASTKEINIKEYKLLSPSGHDLEKGHPKVKFLLKESEDYSKFLFSELLE